MLGNLRLVDVQLIAFECEICGSHYNDRQTCRAGSVLTIPAMTDELREWIAPRLILHRAAKAAPGPTV